MAVGKGTFLSLFFFEICPQHTAKEWLCRAHCQTRFRACLGPRFLRRRQRNAENPAKHHVTDALIPIAAAAGCSYFNWNAAYSGSEGICASLHRDFAYRAAGGHENKQVLSQADLSLAIAVLLHDVWFSVLVLACIGWILFG